MPFDGNGNYELPQPAYPAVAGDVIEAADRNTIDEDLRSALSSVLCRNGEGAMTANLPMGGNKITGMAAASANGDAVRWEQLAEFSRADGGTSSAARVATGTFITYTEVVGGGGAFSGATGLYTAPVTGLYRVEATLALIADATPTNFIGQLYRNGVASLIPSVLVQVVGNGTGSMVIQGLIALTAADTLGVNLSGIGGGSASCSSFSVHRVA